MGSIEDGDSNMSSNTTDVGIPMRTQEKFIECIYCIIDETAGIELDRLRIEDGIIPTCKLGCHHCCKQHILVNMAEARTLSQYIKREFSMGEINDLRIRTQQWHAWDNNRPGRYPSPNSKEQEDLCGYEPCYERIKDSAQTGEIAFCCYTHEKKDNGQAAAHKELRAALSSMEEIDISDILNEALNDEPN